MSGQQTSSLFSSGFMVGQYEDDTINDNVESKSDTHGYDMVGNAQLNSVVEVTLVTIRSITYWNNLHCKYFVNQGNKYLCNFRVTFQNPLKQTTKEITSKKEYLKAYRKWVG